MKYRNQNTFLINISRFFDIKVIFRIYQPMKFYVSFHLYINII